MIQAMLGMQKFQTVELTTNRFIVSLSSIKADVKARRSDLEIDDAIRSTYLWPRQDHQFCQVKPTIGMYGDES